VKAAEEMKSMHGSWRVAWGKIHRTQRTTKKAGVLQAATAFNGLFPSVASTGAPGPLGVIFTTYCTPSVRFLRPSQYAVVGAAYLATVEFGDRVRGASLTPYGQSSNRSSPHFFDQAKLMSEKKLKTAWLYKEDVLRHAVRSYHPGKESETSVE